MKLLDKGCNFKDDMSCHYLSGIFMTGIPKHVPENWEKAFEYASKACDLGNMYACSNVSAVII